MSERELQNDIEGLKYLATLSVLVDLSMQGWVFEINGDKITLKMETDNVDDKQRIRYRLSAERNAQFTSESVSNFIKQMEADKKWGISTISVKKLIGDKDALIEKIRKQETVCDPYIQLVTNERDELTGYKLSDIWRYFRYTWSIPYKTMPGRNLFYLVRDRAQEYHPIIGIFALGNSVLNLTVRDDDIGWTVDAIKANMSRLSDTTTCEQIISGTEGKTIKTRTAPQWKVKMSISKDPTNTLAKCSLFYNKISKIRFPKYTCEIWDTIGTPSFPSRKKLTSSLQWRQSMPKNL